MVLYALLPYLRLILIEILTEWKLLLSSVCCWRHTSTNTKARNPAFPRCSFTDQHAASKNHGLDYTGCMSSSKKSLRSGMPITHCANYILLTQWTSSSCYTYTLYPSKLSPSVQFPPAAQRSGRPHFHHRCSHLRLDLLSSSWSPPLPPAEQGVGWEEEGATELRACANGTASVGTWGAAAGAHHHCWQCR